MSINKLPSVEHYWSTDNCIGNQGLRNVMTKPRFKEILCNIHFSDNDAADSSDKMTLTVYSFLTISFPALIQFKHCFKKKITALELSEQIGKTCLHFHHTKKFKPNFISSTLSERSFYQISGALSNHWNEIQSYYWCGGSLQLIYYSTSS